jgi:uncharacterized protein YecE (DUF72 family)
MIIRTGTSGYSYPAWKGKFYPKELRTRQMLSFYSEKFSTVEINNTFYKMPTGKLVASWAAEVGPDFQFAVKAPQKITHHQRLKGSSRTVAAFVKLSALLGDKRGPLLFQLPPNFKKDLPRLTAFLKVLPTGIRTTFEFRHDSWFTDDVYRLLQDNGVALCIAEDEKLATPLVATAGWGYLRLRREDYREKDVARWADLIRKQKWDRANVYFKHEDSAKGPKLAAMLQSLVSR